MVADALVQILNPMDLNAGLVNRGFDLTQFKEKSEAKKVNIVPVELSGQYQNRSQLDETLRDHGKRLESRVLTVRERNNPDQIRYLDGQIEEYVVTNPQWAEKLSNGGIESVLEFGLEMAKKGMGNHNGSFNPDKITDAFNIHQRPETKCAVFNLMYELICERTMDRFNPQLRDQYLLIHTGSSFALDLPRTKTEYSKNIPHAFITLVSQDQEGRVNYSAVDPYHEESGATVAQKLDFTSERATDSLNVVVDLLFADYWTGYSISPQGEQVREIAVVDMVKNAPDPVSGGEVALLMSYHWGRVLKDSQVARKDFEDKRQVLAHMIENFGKEKQRMEGEGRDVSLSKNSYLRSLRDGCIRMYNNQTNSYQEIHHKLQYVEDARGDFESTMETAVNGLMSEINKEGVVDPKAALIFFDLMDNIGNFGISVSEETWVKAIDFVRSQREENGAAWQKMMAPGARREWNSLLKRHYENSWGTKPVETVVTKKDSEQVNEQDPRYAYTLFRAEVLRLIRTGGIRSWEKYLPKAEPAGSYTELLVNLAKQEN